MRRIAILGSGAREHALCWKLSKSLQVEQIFCIPGNAGTEEEKNVRNVNIQLIAENFERLVTFSKMNKIDLVVVGPEEPLMNGITDLFKSCGIACFGPSSKAAIIESSKVFSKDFMMKYHIPTASYKAFSNYKEAVQHIENLDYPFVIKASGLASGKGVFLPETIDAARDTLRKLMIERLLGKAGSEVVIERRLSGTEISVLGFSDGYSILPMPIVQDHKRLLDGDRGPNTGGMGACVPLAEIQGSVLESVARSFLKRTIDGLRKEGRPFVGVLYAGMMLLSNDFQRLSQWETEKELLNQNIAVLEFNCRFGDPEAVPLLLLLETDLLEILDACVQGHLDSLDVHWYCQSSIDINSPTASCRPTINAVREDRFQAPIAAAAVVIASGGYACESIVQRGIPIHGLKHTVPSLVSEVSIERELKKVFHAGTIRIGNDLVTNGGRVLCVAAIGQDLSSAISSCYAIIENIHFAGMQFRKDIGANLLSRGLRGLAEEDNRKSSELHRMCYRECGVSLTAAEKFVQSLRPLARSTLRSGSEQSELGGFGGVFDLHRAGYTDPPLLVSGTDGVGTKLLVAQHVGQHRGVGIDLVAMSVNDVVVHGAEPLFFLDYLAVGGDGIDMDTASSVLDGIANGCREAGCALVGGETAQMTDMYAPGVYDLAGFAVGAVHPSQLLPMSVSPGNILLGLASSGLHANGFALVRRLVALQKNSSGGSCKCLCHRPIPSLDPLRPLSALLLEPTRIYVRACLSLVRRHLVRAMAHVTGGGLPGNVSRALGPDVAAEIDLGAWKLPPLFCWLAQCGLVPLEDLLSTFNCGIGMVLVVEQAHEAEAVALLTVDCGEIVYRIGHLVKRAPGTASVLFQRQACWEQAISAFPMDN